MAGQTVRGTGDKTTPPESRGKKRVGKGEIQAVCPVDPPVSYWPELTWFIRRITLPRAETPQMWKWSRSWRKRLLSISGKLKLIRLLSSVRDHSPSLTQQFFARRAAVSASWDWLRALIWAASSVLSAFPPPGRRCAPPPPRGRSCQPSAHRVGQAVHCRSVGLLACLPARARSALSILALSELKSTRSTLSAASHWESP